MLPPRWLADEMLGRLARYLRFVGLDVAYVRNLEDAAVATWAREEGRFLLTRDRVLARAVSPSLCLAHTDLEGQWRELRAAFPDLPGTVRLARCSLCNGELEPWSPPTDQPLPAGVPTDRRAERLPLYRCSACGHVYWEGSHMAHVQKRLWSWSGGSSP